MTEFQLMLIKYLKESDTHCRNHLDWKDGISAELIMLDYLQEYHDVDYRSILSIPKTPRVLLDQLSTHRYYSFDIAPYGRISYTSPDYVFSINSTNILSNVSLICSLRKNVPKLPVLSTSEQRKAVWLNPPFEHLEFLDIPEVAFELFRLILLLRHYPKESFGPLFVPDPRKDHIYVSQGGQLREKSFQLDITEEEVEEVEVFDRDYAEFLTKDQQQLFHLLFDNWDTTLKFP